MSIISHDEHLHHLLDEIEQASIERHVFTIEECRRGGIASGHSRRRKAVAILQEYRRLALRQIEKGQEASRVWSQIDVSIDSYTALARRDQRALRKLAG